MSPLRRLAAFTTSAIAMVHPAVAGPIEVGAALPALRSTDHDGTEVDLAKTGSAGWLLVFFYPKADTPGCTKQACSLRDAWRELSERKVAVLGVSMDTPAAQKAFREKHKLPFPLLADKEGRVADAFGVPHTAGFAKRQAYLFKDGKLVWRDLNAATAEQAADVLKALEPEAENGGRD